MLFRPEAVRERRRRISGAVLLSQPLSLRLLTAVLTLLVAAAAWFLFTFEFQRRESVRGYVTSSQGIVTLRATNGGILTRRFVDIGDSVESGTSLFEATTEIDSTQGPTRHAQLENTERQLREVAAQLVAVEKAYADRRTYLAKKRSGLESRADELGSRLSTKRQILAVASERLDRLRTLRAKQHVSDSDFTQQLERVLESRTRVEELQSQANRVANDVELLELEIATLPEREAKERSELRIREYTLRQSFLEQQSRSSYIVRAPVAGRISAFRGDVGHELAPGAPVVSVLPRNARLVVNLLAPSRAIGFIERHGEVNLLIDAFAYQKFGVQRGRIAEVSESAYRPGELDVPVAYSESVYKVIVELEHDYVPAYGRRHPLQVDMTLTGDLVVDRRSLVRWLLDPLIAVRL